MLSGAIGLGLSRNVKQLYTSLARIYEPEDKLYFFGFSRGAFTVRSLAGFISEVGLVNGSHPDLQDMDDLERAVSDAYAEFRQTFGGAWEHTKRLFRKKTELRRDVLRYKNIPIEFIGVWDTVDAVGLPFDEATQFLNLLFRFKFPDTKLSKQVKRACHAISLDDERRTFKPVIWDETDEQDPDRIMQVWFAGVHSNVGGGYVKQGMSLVPLNWMMDEAEKSGLRFVRGDRQNYIDHAYVHDKMYDSRSGSGMYYRYLPRNVSQLCKEKGVVPTIHHSALERVALCTEGYAPANWPPEAIIHAGPDKMRQKTLLGIIGSSPLLMTSKRYGLAIQLRKFSQYALLGSSVWLALAALTPQANGSYWQVLHLRLVPDFRSGFVNSFQNFLSQLWDVVSQAISTQFPELLLKTLMHYPVFAIVMFIAWLGSFGAKRYQQQIASRYWHRVSLRIKNIFL